MKERMQEMKGKAAGARQSPQPGERGSEYA